MFARADVQLEGQRPWDIRVQDDRFHRRLVRHGLDGLGDSYVDGWWTCPHIDQMMHRCLEANLGVHVRYAWPNVRAYLLGRLVPQQTRVRAMRDVGSHYDLGNDLFQAFLDPTMTYTCGYWAEGVHDLEAAQLAKLELVCRKLHLEPGMRLLDIGCGWGSFLKHAAERYGITGLGVCLSHRQVALGSERCRGLPVELRYQDYRDIGEEAFDRVVSLGMFEHVGPRFYRRFMQAAHRCLKDQGLMLLHNFGAELPSPTLDLPEVTWVNRHIFPGLVLPSFGQIGKAADGLFAMHDVQNFGRHYDPTLMAWARNFDANWERIKDNYGERFRRMWRYYLHIAAGGFRSGKFPLWQTVFQKGRSACVYEAVR